MCDRVGVLYAGQFVEEGPAETVLRGPAASVHGRPAPLHPARRRPQGSRPARHDPGLPAARSARTCRAASSSTAARSPTSAAVRRSRRRSTVGDGHRQPLPLPRARARPAARRTAADLELPPIDRGGEPLLVESTTAKIFKQRGHDVHALVGVSAAIWPGETLGLVGESGAARRRSRGRCSASSQPTTGAVDARGPSAAATLRRSARARSCGRCRSSSRTPTRRSTGATRCAGSCCAR